MITQNTRSNRNQELNEAKAEVFPTKSQHKKVKRWMLNEVAVSMTHFRFLERINSVNSLKDVMTLNLKYEMLKTIIIQKMLTSQQYFVLHLSISCTIACNAVLA